MKKATMTSMERIAETRAGPNDSGAFLIDLMTRRFTYLSRDLWLEAMASGALTVNGAATSTETVLSMGDLIRFDPKGIAEPPADERYAVVYEDEDALVVDKSASLPVHPGGRFFSRTLWYLLRSRLPAVHIVTRLDRETSGLVLVAKNPTEARRLQAEGAVDKRYLALVRGKFPSRMEARGVLVGDAGSVVRKKRAYVDASDPRYGQEADGGQSCLTLFELVEERDGESLVSALLGTGRTHQIRATLRSLGFPIIGDKLYGIDETIFVRFSEGRMTAEDRRALRLPGQALHCAGLNFTSSAGKMVEAEAAPPEWAKRRNTVIPGDRARKKREP